MSVKHLLETLQLPLFDPSTILPSLDTSYTKHFTLNHVASISEIPTIRGIISQHLEQVNAIDTIVARVESILHQFREKRDQIVSSLRTQEGFISCIRRLPSDVLGEIFMQCPPEAEYLTPNKKAAPLLLTRVCRRWREVALDTPRLWCSLWIRAGGGDFEKQFAFYREHWLKNASLYPLTLAVDLHSTSKLRLTSVVEFALHYTIRCKRLNVYFLEAYGLDRLLEDVPVLECLVLNGQLPRNGKPISIFQRHPHLQTLFIESPQFPVDVLPEIGWANLTCLVVRFGVPAHDDHDSLFLLLLEQCPNLEAFFFPVPRSRGRSQPLTHLKLRVLGFQLLSDEIDEGAFLDTVNLPNLHRIFVCGPFHRARNLLDGILMFKQRSLRLNGPGHRTFNVLSKRRDCFGQCHTLFTMFNPGWEEITHIRMEIKETGGFVMALLQFCPNLEEIVISQIDLIRVADIPITHPILRSLTICINYGPITSILNLLTLPKLRHFDLALPEDPDWPHEAFKEFLSRSQCPLETITISGPTLSIEEREEFSSLIPTLRRLELLSAMERPAEWGMFA